MDMAALECLRVPERMILVCAAVELLMDDRSLEFPLDHALHVCEAGDLADLDGDGAS